jgi:hypothetical protein
LFPSLVFSLSDDGPKIDAEPFRKSTVDACYVLKAIPVGNDVFYGACTIFYGDYIFKIDLPTLLSKPFMCIGVVTQQDFEAGGKKLSRDARANGTRALWRTRVGSITASSGSFAKSPVGGGVAYRTSLMCSSCRERDWKKSDSRALLVVRLDASSMATRTAATALSAKTNNYYGTASLTEYLCLRSMR